MSRLLFVGLANCLIALYAFSPIAATGGNDQHALVDMVNKFEANVMPSLQTLRNIPEYPYKGGPMSTLGQMVDDLEKEFAHIHEHVQNDSKGHHKPNAIWTLFGAIKGIVYSDLVALRNNWYGIWNPNAQSFTRYVDPKAGHAELNVHLMAQLDQLKKELYVQKQNDVSLAEFVDYRKRAQQLAFDCVDTLKEMDDNMTRIAGRRASVPEEDLPWALSALAVNLWAYAALGVPGAEQVANMAEEAHPIKFKIPKGSGVEKAESSDGKNVAGKTGAKHVHDTNKMG